VHEASLQCVSDGNQDQNSCQQENNSYHGPLNQLRTGVIGQESLEFIKHISAPVASNELPAGYRKSVETGCARDKAVHFNALPKSDATS